MPSWLPRSFSAVIATGGLLLLSGLSLAACSASDTGSEAASKTGTIPIAVRGDTGPSNDVERTLDRIAKEIASNTDTSTSGGVEVVGARRVGDFGVEVLYRYLKPVDADIRAALILSRLATPEAYTESEFHPIVDGLNVPDTRLYFSYFQPDGEQIISIQCSYVHAREAIEGDWRQAQSAGGDCSESQTLADGYASGELVAP